MKTAREDLLGPGNAESDAAAHSTGILPSQEIEYLLRASKEIVAIEPVQPDQFQPASLDLRLGGEAWRVRASFLPGKNATVMQRLADLEMHRMSITDGAVLERGCVYIIPLLEGLRLRSRTSAMGNPKSSTGRLDVFVRLITDYGTEFDRVREGYKGPLYAEVSPRAFSILVRTGSRLVQLRIRRGSPAFSDTALRRLHEEVRLLEAPTGALREREAIRNGLAFTADVGGDEATGIVGFKARRHTAVIDVDRVAHYDPREFWEAVYAHPGPGKR